MKTKLFFLSLIFMLSGTLINAQSTTKAKSSFAILGGINFQNLNGTDSDGDKLENDLLLGYHAGVNIQIPIAPQFYFQPGLLFSIKGAKNTDDVLGNTYTSTTKISYIEMPLNLVYKGALGNGFVMLGFGPYVGYGIGGEVKIEGGSVTVENDIEFTNTVETGDELLIPYYKAFDVGGNIFAGYEISQGLFVQMNAQLGMVKINPEDKRISDDKTSVKNTGFGLSLGYRF